MAELVKFWTELPEYNKASINALIQINTVKKDSFSRDQLEMEMRPILTDETDLYSD